MKIPILDHNAPPAPGPGSGRAEEGPFATDAGERAEKPGRETGTLVVEEEESSGAPGSPETAPKISRRPTRPKRSARSGKSPSTPGNGEEYRFPSLDLLDVVKNRDPKAQEAMI